MKILLCKTTSFLSASGLESDRYRLMHTFLDINDYHRYHFPIDGTIKEVRIIQSDDAVGGIITWDARTKKYLLEATNPG